MRRVLSLLLVFMMLFGTFSFASTNTPSSWANTGVNELKAYNEFRESAFQNYQSNITRAQFIYLAVRIYELFDGKEISVDPSIKFSDTTDIYALKGATVGITSGIGSGKFGPNQQLTREQLAVMMINTLQLGNLKMTASTGYKFNDESKFSSWAKDKIYLAKANGIISGVGSDMFNAQGQATIEQALLITNQILKNNNGKQWTSKGEMAHIIDLTAKTATSGQKIAEMDWGTFDVSTNQEILDKMSKYGDVGVEKDSKITANSIGISYYSKGFLNQASADMKISFPSEKTLKITLGAYDDKIKSIITDFIDVSFGKGVMDDVVKRVFADIDSVKGINNLGYTWYATEKLSGKSVTVNSTTISYNEEAYFEIKIEY